MPGSWPPDAAIDNDAVLPISPGRHLDAGYSAEVVCAVWAWKTRQCKGKVAAA